MATLQPRAVLVTRPSDYERLLAAHATREQARFFLKTRGQDLDGLLARHETLSETVRMVRQAIPDEWRVARVRRADLDRFLFAPEDVVLAVGQDGLVANLAKYLSGQPVLGINPEPEVNEGVLVSLDCNQVAALLPAAGAGRAAMESRTMAVASLDDGQELTALNEVFIGHRSHQSARYVISLGQESEQQSSSGVIVSTGTGASGWARSIMTAIQHRIVLAPDDPSLAYFVREPWPSLATGTSIARGRLETGQSLDILSNMNEGGVIFADGMEQDHLAFDWGRRVSIGTAPQALNLVRAA